MDGIKYIILVFMIFFLAPTATASQNIEYKNVPDGGSWGIGGDYYIRVEGVDYLGEQAFVSIWRNGEMLQEDLVQNGGTFVYRDSSGTMIVSMKVASIFRGMSGSICRFSNIYLRYGESGGISTSTPTPTKTATSTRTPEALETMNVDFGDGAVIPGLSLPLAVAILLFSAFTLKKE